MAGRHKKKKLNKYEQLTTAEDEFDFHGKGALNEFEIRDMAHGFLWQAYQRRLHKVRIITGKGLHSKDGAVIKPILLAYIPTLPFVRASTTARIDEGGEGALSIILEENI